MTYDAIVIGAGTNGLVAAQLLQRAGRRVLVLERSDKPLAGIDAGWVPPRVVQDLGLAQQGLVVDQPDPWLSIPLDGGGRLELSRDVARSAEAIRRVSPADAAKWPGFCARMRCLASVLEQLYTQPAPDVETTQISELLRLAALGLKVKGLGRQAMIDLLRIPPMSVAELLDDWFEHDALKGALGAAGVMHMHQGPRSAGTAFTLLHHHVGCEAGVFRPSWTNLGRTLESLAGVEVRRGATVEGITIAGGRVSGVVLKGGATIEAPRVISNADPRRTMLELLQPGWLDPEYLRAIRNIKCRGIAARVTLHTGKTPDFSTLVVAPSLTYIERAYDEAKYGRVSPQPYLEAHREHDRVTVLAQYVPHTPSDGAWDDARRKTYGEAVLKRLVQAAPGLHGTVQGMDVHGPADIEREAGLTGGHQYQGELTLDQVLFMRPVPGWSRYRTPIAGLYLCGAGTHPGGAVAGGAGWLAAREILGDV